MLDFFVSLAHSVCVNTSAASRSDICIHRMVLTSQISSMQTKPFHNNFFVCAFILEPRQLKSEENFLEDVLHSWTAVSSEFNSMILFLFGVLMPAVFQFQQCGNIPYDYKQLGYRQVLRGNIWKVCVCPCVYIPFHHKV